MVSKAREMIADIRMIIISGYAQFEYAQTAIKHGVSEYLLKPINQQELQNALSRLKQDILVEKREKTQEYIQGSRIDISRIQGSLIQDLLEEQDKTITEDVIRNQYHLDVQTGSYQVFCMKMDYEISKMRKEDIQILEQKMKQILDCSMPRYCHEWVTVSKRGYVYGIMNFSPQNTEKIRNMLRECLNQLEAHKRLLGAVEFSLGLGGIVKSPGDLRKSLAEAKLAVGERVLEGTGKLLELKERKSTLFEQKLLDKFLKKIDCVLEMLSMDEIATAVDELYQSIQTTPQVRGWEIFELVESAGEIFAMKIGNVPKEALQEFGELCQNSSSVEQLMHILRKFAEGLMEGVLRAREEDSSRPVRIAKQYIQNHYNEQITIEEVSDKVGLSPAYFSILFKKETEVGFAKYLMNIRMEQAKMLLRETGYSVAEICKKVGYNDIKHFGHTFEKVAGVKPTTYRKLYG